MNPTAEEFKRRLPASESANVARTLIDDVFKFPEAVRSRAAPIKADPMLSPQGKATALQQLVTEGGIPAHFGQFKRQAAELKSVVERARANLQPKAPPKDDWAALLIAREIRDHLKSLTDAQRMRAALETPEFASAIIHAPAALSGLTDQIKIRVVEATIEREAGPRLAELREREQIVEVVEAAVQVAEQQMHSAATLENGDM